MILNALTTLMLGAAPQAQPNNILIVVLDDVGVDMVGCYEEGPNPAPTPVLDSLATTGVLFRNTWANPVCSPSRAEILTGRYGYRTGLGRIVSQAGWALDVAEFTIPERLEYSETDYSCGAFGKWHLSNEFFGGGDLGPNIQGFDHFVGTAGNLSDPQTFYEFELITNGVTTTTDVYATTRIVDDALAWIQTREQPWFAYVAFQAPHSPYHEPPSGLNTLQSEMAGLDPRLVPRPFYKAMLEAADTELGRLLDGLGPDLENTQIIVVADNGTPAECSIAPFIPEHAKLTPFEGGINVPMIIAGPSVVDPGREVDALVCITDIFLTVADWANASPQEGSSPGYLLDSISLLPYLEDPGAAPLRDVVYADFYTPNDPSGFGATFTRRMIRDERYKLIQRLQPPNTPFLYDLWADPFETTNLLAGPIRSIEYGFIAQGLAWRLAAILAGEDN